MRENLAKINTQRIFVTARVSRFGSKTNYHGFSEATIYLVDLKNLDGENLTNYIWFSVGKIISKMCLKEQEIIQFEARVSPYCKGYFKDTLDFKLNNISKIKRLVDSQCSHAQN